MSPLEALGRSDTDTSPGSDQLVSVTPVALEKLIELRAEESDAEQLGLRLEIVSERGEDFRYDL
ncbi:MAG: hypothetical protein M3517_10435, partial [Actinomycetota bacterium]|nr:hypothetical protein [Actinomycetota bacterium]